MSEKISSGMTGNTGSLDLGYCHQLRITNFELVAGVLNGLHSENFYTVTRGELQGSEGKQRAVVERADGQSDLSEFWRAVEGLNEGAIVVNSLKSAAAALRQQN